ncbi:MAG: hypothetical protein FJW39_03745 [Acidobacteria bacterium]|nr:hypothetical protein [Acidobacteriota bacterium]
MSLGRRIELGKRVRELSGRVQFLEAGETMAEQVESGVLRNEIDKLYLEWGLASIAGLIIDGEEARPPKLIESGPESLAREILAAIKRELDLSEEERKNS